MARLETTDPDQMSEFIAPLVGAARFGKLHDQRQFAARIEMVTSGRIGFMMGRLCNTRFSSEPALGGTHVHLTLSGAAEIDRGSGFSMFGERSADASVRGRGDQSFHLHSAATTFVVVSMDAGLLRETSIKQTGGRYVSASHRGGKLNLHSREGWTFLRLAHALFGDLHGGTMRDRQMAAVESEFATQFLLAANQAGAPLDGQDKAPNAVAIQRAQDWIMSNLAEQITRAELCAISGLHVRTLTRGFGLKYGVGPIQFVRDRRLDAVRNTLLAGTADEISVTRVAEDYGMYHLGRFSHDYRLRFHELPTRTLKR
jgi:AraC-like DNA-binding protein